MQMIPQNSKDMKEVLSKQIGLLAEQSEKHKDEPHVLTELTNSMKDIVEVWLARYF